jgi:hypothetical protein
MKKIRPMCESPKMYGPRYNRSPEKSAFMSNSLCGPKLSERFNQTIVPKHKTTFSILQQKTRYNNE